MARDALMSLRLVLATCGLFLAAMILPCRAENEAAIKEFGVSKSKPINTSFFFWNFKYVEVPYFVERRGLDVFINGILVQAGPEWPQEDLTVKDDPGDPPPDYRFFSFKSGLNHKKWRYLSGKYELEEARRLMVQFYQKCSDVADVAWNPHSGSFMITSKDGKKVNVGLNTWWKEGILSKEELLDLASYAAKSYEMHLREVGSLLAMGTNIREVRLGALKVSSFVGIHPPPPPPPPSLLGKGDTETAFKILGIMLSDLPAAVKVKQLEVEKLDLMYEVRRLVTECPRNEQLVKRFEMLKKGELKKDPP